MLCSKAKERVVTLGREAMRVPSAIVWMNVRHRHLLMLVVVSRPRRGRRTEARTLSCTARWSCSPNAPLC